MKYFTKSLIAASLALGLSTQYVNAETNQVGVIAWETSAPADLEFTNIPENMSQLVFIRFPDGMTTVTNANISVDTDYQTSIESGHLSHVMVCHGDHQISTQVTANKSNDLTFNSQPINTLPKKTYFYRVEVNEQGNTILSPLSPDITIDNQNLIDYIATMPKQAHQISRVNANNCPVYMPPPPPVVAPEPIVFNKPITLDVLFEFDKAVVVPQYYSRIADMAQFMKENNARAVIEGHTDSVGTDAYNLDLSKRRANAVKELMVNQYGVAPNRLETVGYGESQPIAPNTTKEGRQQNRRVMATAIAITE